MFVNRGWVAMKETDWNRTAGQVTLNTIVGDLEKARNELPYCKLSMSCFVAFCIKSGGLFLI